MKGLLLSFILLFWGTFSVNAQNRSIRFLDDNWNIVLKKAERTGKLIFVDCYTSWCGPCQTLAKEVFTLDSVADFFNRHFLCVKLDIEKGKGLELKKPFEIRAYPTLLFLDGKQQVVHRIVGCDGAEYLMKEAGKALDPQLNFRAMQERYMAGERATDFILEYLNYLGHAYLEEEANAIALQYLQGFKEEELITSANWKIIEKYIKDPLAIPLQVVMKRRKAFFDLAPEQEVINKLNLTCRSALLPFTRWRPDSEIVFDERYYDALVAYFKSVDYDLAPECLANLYTAGFMYRGDYSGMLEEMKRVMAYGIVNSYMKEVYLMNYLSALKYCDEPTLVRQGVTWVERLEKEWAGYSLVSALQVHTALEKCLGNTEKAEQLSKQARQLKEDTTAEIMKKYNLK